MGDSGINRPRSTSTPRPLPKPLQGDMWPRVVTRLRLAPQEARVVELVVLGDAPKAIARRLDLGLPTVRTYLNRAFVRAGAECRVQLAVRVMEIAREIEQGGEVSPIESPRA